MENHQLIMEKENSLWTKTQLLVFYVIILLAIDEINPVKVLLHVFPTLSPWHVAVTSGLLMLYIFISDLKAILYFCVKTFFHSILSIFFAAWKSPDDKIFHPMVLSFLPFMDAVMVVCTAKRQVSYLMAEASWKRRLIGDFAWALGVVPVKRAQDDAAPGTGTIRLDYNNDGDGHHHGSVVATAATAAITTKSTTTPTLVEPPSSSFSGGKHRSAVNDDTPLAKAKNPITWRVTGSGTSFRTDLEPGDKIRPPGTAHGLKVIKVESDTELLVDATGLPDDFPTTTLLPPPLRGNNTGGATVTAATATAVFVPYDVLKHTPLNKVFEKVLDRLAAGGALGIFPEGGSSDRTDLLPLKIGVSLIAFSALDKDGLNIPIVPVGLNYYRAHRWRGRAVVEYGRPIQIDPVTLVDYQAGDARRRTVCNALLEQVETAMRSVIVAAPDYDDLQTMLTARRLFQRKRGPMSTKETLELTRRFAEGSKRMMLLNDGDLDEEGQDLRNRLVAYRDALDDLGLKDYQVQALTEERLLDDDDDVVDGDRMLRFLQLTYNIVHKLILIVLSAIPLLLLNLPVGVLAGVYAERRRKKALAKSKVKVKGYDVMLTEKVVFSIVAVPTLWFIYGLLLRFGTSLDGPTIAFIMFSMPIFAYLGIVVVESGIIGWHDLRPNLMRLYPSTRKRLAALPALRKELQEDLRAYLRKIGPKLGDIYFDKTVDWQKIQEENAKLGKEAASKKTK